MENLTKNLEKSLLIIQSEKERLEKKLSKIPNLCGDGEAERAIQQNEINSKLFWLGSLSGRIKNDVEDYKDLIDKINLIQE